MSHVVEIKTRLLSIEAIMQTCKDLGLTFKANQRTYKWWGSSAGGYPLPAGFKKEDMGKCEHAIGVPGTTWEIGVAKARNPDGTCAPGWTLLFDFYGSSGRPILNAIGERTAVERLKKIGWNYQAGMVAAEHECAKAGRFLQTYGVNVAIQQAKSKGYTYQRTVSPTGAITLTINA